MYGPDEIELSWMRRRFN